jgi:hypothetical protein
MKLIRRTDEAEPYRSAGIELLARLYTFFAVAGTSFMLSELRVQLGEQQFLGWCFTAAMWFWAAWLSYISRPVGH